MNPLCKCGHRESDHPGATDGCRRCGCDDFETPGAASAPPAPTPATHFGSVGRFLPGAPAPAAPPTTPDGCHNCANLCAGRCSVQSPEGVPLPADGGSDCPLHAPAAAPPTTEAPRDLADLPKAVMEALTAFGSSARPPVPLAALCDAVRLALREAREEGRASMREEAAALCRELARVGMDDRKIVAYEYAADRIRALSGPGAADESSDKVE